MVKSICCSLQAAAVGATRKISDYCGQRVGSKKESLSNVIQGKKRAGYLFLITATSVGTKKRGITEHVTVIRNRHGLDNLFSLFSSHTCRSTG